MHISELLQKQSFALPKERGGTDFEEFLQNLLGSYKANLESIDASCPICKKVFENRGQAADISQLILQTVKLFLNGFPSGAFKCLATGLDGALGALVAQDVSAGDLGNVYRVTRAGMGEIHKARLFHVPFDSRNKVAAGRYGIAGFPCLSLGASLDVCISEVRAVTEKLDQYAASRFCLRPGVSLKILDLGFRPDLIGASAGNCKFNQNSGYASATAAEISRNADYALAWPLIAASSLKVPDSGDRKDPFKFEYIVPQLVLQWIMETNQCDGICYFSTRYVPEILPKLRPTKNFVFPARQKSPKDRYSRELLECFEMTDPVRLSSDRDLKSVQEELDKAISAVLALQ